MIKRIALAGIWLVIKMLPVNFILKNSDLSYRLTQLWEVVTDGLKLFLPVRYSINLSQPYLGQKNVSVGGFSNVVLSCDNIIETYKELESQGVKFIEKLDMQN